MFILVSGLFFRMEEEDETGQTNDVSLTRPSLGGSDFDDELGVPETYVIVDVGDGPVAIERSDDEIEGKPPLGQTKINQKKFKMMLLMDCPSKPSTNHQLSSSRSKGAFLFLQLIFP